MRYDESHDIGVDLSRLADPSDGHMDEVHALRDRHSADLVHLLVAGGSQGGVAFRPGAYGVTYWDWGTGAFAHELGHNMGLSHDRYQVHHHEGTLIPQPGYGYVNQRALEAGAPRSNRWRTMMSYDTQCADAGFSCTKLLRFANPRQVWSGDPLGVPYEPGASGVAGPADAAAVLNATGPVVAEWRVKRTNRAPVPVVGALPDRRLAPGGAVQVYMSQAFVDPDGDELRYTATSSAPDSVRVFATGGLLTLTAVNPGVAVIRVTATDPDGLRATQEFTVTVEQPNRAPVAVGTLPDRKLAPRGTVHVDVARAFADPDGDVLRYTASSSAPAVVTAFATGTRVRLTAVSPGAAAIRVTATDPDGLRATQEFTATVPVPFTDDPIRPGVTPVRAVHFTELRSRIDGLRRGTGLAAFDWTDPELRAGVTPVRTVHLLELRSALAEAYTAAGRPAPRWTDALTAAGATPIRGAHITELRAAVVTLE